MHDKDHIINAHTETGCLLDSVGKIGSLHGEK
jgi:hypothetical protein